MREITIYDDKIENYQSSASAHQPHVSHNEIIVLKLKNSAGCLILSKQTKPFKKRKFRKQMCLNLRLTRSCRALKNWRIIKINLIYSDNFLCVNLV